MGDMPSGRDYRILRERQISNPFNFARRVHVNGVLGTPEIFDLFTAERGYDTVIDVFRVITTDPFATADIFRAGLLGDGKLIDGYKNSSFNDGILASIPDIFTANQIANGMLPVLMIQASFSRHSGYWRVKAGARIQAKIENYVSVPDVPVDVTIYVSGGQVTP